MMCRSGNFGKVGLNKRNSQVRVKHRRPNGCPIRQDPFSLGARRKLIGIVHARVVIRCGQPDTLVVDRGLSAASRGVVFRAKMPTQNHIPLYQRDSAQVYGQEVGQAISAIAKVSELRHKGVLRKTEERRGGTTEKDGEYARSSSRDGLHAIDSVAASIADSSWRAVDTE